MDDIVIIGFLFDVWCVIGLLFVLIVDCMELRGNVSVWVDLFIVSFLGGGVLIFGID